jgi:hypothetical protein
MTLMNKTDMTMVERLQHLAGFAREQAKASKTAKDKAYYGGKAEAFTAAADMLELVERGRS